MKPARFTGYVYNKATHTADTDCLFNWNWCRIHWFPDYGRGPVPYPLVFNHRSSRMPSGWERVWVHHGPAAWLPKRPNLEQQRMMAAYCPHDQMRLDCNNCLRHSFHPLEIQ